MSREKNARNPKVAKVDRRLFRFYITPHSHWLFGSQTILIRPVCDSTPKLGSFGSFCPAARRLIDSLDQFPSLSTRQSTLQHSGEQHELLQLYEPAWRIHHLPPSRLSPSTRRLRQLPPRTLVGLTVTRKRRTVTAHDESRSRV